jgi:ankyrin repeat protein
MNAKLLLRRCLAVLVMGVLAGLGPSADAQVPPSATEISKYTGLHQAAQTGDVTTLRDLIAGGTDLELRDGAGRTALHVAAYASRDEVVRMLADAGADMNALENRAYDIVTIAAVANDLDLLDLALSLGGASDNITSPYEGTALIAAAHLGHAGAINRLIEGGAPLDHVNNLDWTALIEAVVLGDGGPDHIATVRYLVEAGADRTITDRDGVTPLEHALVRGYEAIADILAVEP